jgi:purine-nucleoside/S-methyl-5'-thioadenosine phosphorylase / adenosine deaminase
MQLPADWLVPQWPAPACVKALVTTRNGGVSTGPFTSMNLSVRVGDEPRAVAENRARVRAHVPDEPKWLHQVHGTRVVQAEQLMDEPLADATYTGMARIVCAVQVADCLPVLFCDRDGTRVAAAHAGWRGLSAGVLEETVASLGLPVAKLMAWLGPAIGPRAFEVGPDVLTAFGTSSAARGAFAPTQRPGKWLADLFALARERLAAIGVSQVFGGELCTFSDPARFFSHRRDRITGRQAAFIWLE